MIEIYDWLVQQIQTNQFFAGIAIPFVLGGVVYLLRSIPAKIYYYLKLILTLEFTVTTKNEHYDEILKFLYEHRFNLFSRNYSISNTSKYLTPGYGTSIGIYRGVIFIFNRQIFEQKIDLQEQTHITFLTRNLKFINEFFQECTKQEQTDLVHVFAQHQTYFTRLCSRPKRPLSTVFINDHIKEQIIERIDWFLKNEKWYVERGISYKLCICLHGPPGTGKTSLIHAVASHFGYHIKLISELAHIDGILTDSADREDSWDTPKELKNINSVYVVEDIDCLNINKRETKKKTSTDKDKENSTPLENTLLSSYNNMILQKILNTLDGIGTPHGRIIFITTNNISALDPALVRKGRVDCLISIDKLDSEQFVEMFTSFYGEENKHTALDFIAKQKYIPQVGAVLSDLFLNNNPEQSLKALEK